MQPKDPVAAARFSIVIDGHEIASFAELAGITTEVEPVDYLQSAEKEPTFAKLPGKGKPPTIVLKRGMNNSMELWTWHEAVRRGDMAAARRNCSLVLYSAEGKPVARYYLDHAWPSKLEIGAVKAGAGAVLTETVTLVCEQLQRVAP
jgi:phage tail-like protein